MKLGILGCGNMGEAFLQSILERKIISLADILVCDLDPKRREVLSRKYDVATTDKVQELVNQELLLLAIKPQNLRDLPVIEKETIIISMLAGTSVSKLKTKFPQAKIVRIMPNLGQFVGLGMTGVFWDKKISFSSTEKEIIQLILTSDAKVLELEKEDLLDKLAAISGSGPAYFLSFAENIVVAAQELGFTEKEAELLVRQTFVGTAKILQENPEDSLAEWRDKVTSPQGTTAEALRSFKKNDLERIVLSAVRAAEKRAGEINQEN
ncbi:pyrroline-5-carboxylate reductase [Candidatus Gracilibacteria bacterium]|nr:pyrroline-5-carboxylate reductase [Candidatus Gracilibacteria bacterium]